jgi:hypothetical protein
MIFEKLNLLLKKRHKTFKFVNSDCYFKRNKNKLIVKILVESIFSFGPTRFRWVCFSIQNEKLFFVKNRKIEQYLFDNFEYLKDIAYAFNRRDDSKYKRLEFVARDVEKLIKKYEVKNYNYAYKYPHWVR